MSIKSLDPLARKAQRPDAHLDPDTIQIEPNYPFRLVHYPQHESNWVAEEIEANPGVPAEDVGVWLLPVLGHEQVIPGVAGYRTVTFGTPESEAYKHADERIARAGGIVIPTSEGYADERPAQDPLSKRVATYHYLAFQAPNPVAPGKRQTFRFDQQAYRRWRLELVRRGVIPAPTDEIVTERRNRLAKRPARYAGIAELSDQLRERYTQRKQVQVDHERAAKVPVLVEDPKPPARRKVA